MQRRVPFGPEISWPTGYYDLQYQDGGYSYPGQPPHAPMAQGEHPYASYGTGYGDAAPGPGRPDVPDSGYGDPGYLDPRYQGPASEDAGFAAPGYGSPSRQGPGYQGPRQQNSYPPEAYPPDGYARDAYPPDAYRHDAYPEGPRGPGYPDAGYGDGGYPADPRDQARGWAGANFGTGAQELRDYEDFGGPDQRGPASGYGDPRYDGPGYPDSVYGEGQGYDHSGYDRPGYGAEYDGSPYGDSQYGEPGMDEPGYGRLSYDDPRFDQPGPGGAGPGAAGYDDPGYGQRAGYGDGPGYGGPGYDNPGFGAGHGAPGSPGGPFAPDYGDPRYDPRYNDTRGGDPRFEGARFDDTRLDHPRVPGDGPRFDETRLDTPRYQDQRYDDGGYDAARPALQPAGMLAAPTGLLARPDTGAEPWAEQRDVFAETMLDEIPAIGTEQELDETGQFETSRLEAGQFGESAERARRGRRTGRRRGGSNDRRQWLALGGVVVVAAGAIAGVLKFAFPSHAGGPTHTMATPNQIGPYQRKVNLERQMQVGQLRSDVIKTSSGQASNVVSAVYQAGSATPGGTAQIFMFIGGHMANASPATSISSFTQKFPGARVVPVGSLGGQAACVEATENQGNVAMCIWFDNDSFGELVSPTMTTTTLANVMRTVRPSLELIALK